MDKKYLIGFIGQGWIGKNYADSFVDRGYDVVRYGLEAEHVGNKAKIALCDFVFIAVPTPTTPQGFDDRHVRSALTLVGEGKTAVIKSTIPPGTTRALQEAHPSITVIHIPEFLREAHARNDVDNPARLIVGIPHETESHRMSAEVLLQILPPAPHSRIVSAHEAEFIKYTHNAMGYATVVFMNVLYDLAQKEGVDWSLIKEAIIKNPWFPEKYLEPVHQGGRGAGGDCFIKDFAALTEMYKKDLPHDKKGIAFLDAMAAKNNQLLRDSGKSLELLKGVYGDDAVCVCKNAGNHLERECEPSVKI